MIVGLCQYKDPVASNNPDLHFNRAMVRFLYFFPLISTVKVKCLETLSTLLH